MFLCRVFLVAEGNLPLSEENPSASWMMLMMKMDTEDGYDVAMWHVDRAGTPGSAQEAVTNSEVRNTTRVNERISKRQE